MKKYLVSITGTFMADDSEHAIEQFVDMVGSNIDMAKAIRGSTKDPVNEGIAASINDIEELEE